MTAWHPGWALNKLVLEPKVREGLRARARELDESERERRQRMADAAKARCAEERARAQTHSDLPLVPEFPAQSAGNIRLYDPVELEAFRANLNRHHSSYEDQRRAKAIIKELADLGPWRTPLRASREVLRGLKALEIEFPNFVEVVAYLRATLVLHRDAVRLSPLLLDGPAGCGKSYFSMRLAEVLGTPFRLFDAAAASGSLALVGTDKGYENSQSGLVHEVLTGSPSASPVIVVDELDKASQRGDHRYPLTSALYGLWEPRTARLFRDSSVPQVALDARYIVWVGTSNDWTLIPDPIVNRVRVFHITPPSEEQMQAVVRRVSLEVWREAGRRRAPPRLSHEVLHRLCRMPIRTARLRLAELFAKAILAKRNEVVIEDLPNDMAAVVRGLGFI